jgi:hypothetical protein
VTGRMDRANLAEGGARHAADPRARRRRGRVPDGRPARCGPWLALALSLLGAIPAQAGGWEGDYEPGEWLIMTLVANHEGYREAEKLAVGCSEQALFVERYSPAGARPSSSLSLDGASALTVSWDRLDAPNAMWAHGVIARTLVLHLLSARQATFQEIDEPARAPVSFELAGARDAIVPVLDRCGEIALLAEIGAGPAPPQRVDAALR